MNKVLLSGNCDLLQCKNKHLYKKCEATDNNAKCKKCDATIVSIRTLFGCEECHEYICRECVEFNCKGDHGLNPRTNDEERICDLCDMDTTDCYGCNICDFDICKTCIDTKFSYNNWMKFNHLSFHSFNKSYIDYQSDANQNRMGQTFKSEPCGSSNRCKSCKYIQTTNNITSKTYGIKYRLSGKNNCISENGIYAIECRKCNDQYIGSTTQSYRGRQNGHRSGIRNAKVNICETYRHFNTKCKGRDNNLENYSFIPLRSIPLKGNAPEDILFNEYQLNKEERHTMARMGTVWSGLNGTHDFANTDELRRNKSIRDKIPRLFANDYL